MKKHVFRPLWLAVALVAVILLARPWLVPDDFGINGESFTYGYYRLSNVQEWKDFPVKYLGRESCAECHEDNVTSILVSKHQNLQCENCHGPGAGHPDALESLPINRSREHCQRCHQDLEYPNSARSAVTLIDGDRHKRRRECSTCHNPHSPDEEDA